MQTPDISPDITADRQPQFDPIRIAGALDVDLFGLTIGHIRLKLDITSLGRLAVALLSSVSSESTEFSALSRAELYQLATSAGVRGRSAMSRADLIAALETTER